MTFPRPLPVDSAAENGPRVIRSLVAGLALLVLFLCGLFYYKWTGSARTVAAVWSSATWTKPAAGLTAASPAAATIYYFERIWIALVYGLLIGAAVCAFVTPQQIARLLERGGTMRRQAVAAGTGAPLMLCSCCVTPVFTAVYERGARLGSALTIMLASPALNPAALILTFILFPVRIATARLVAASVAVLLLPLIVERIAGDGRALSRAAAHVLSSEDDEGQSSTIPRAFFARFARSLVHITVVTIPLIIVGVLASSLVLRVHANLRAADTVLGVLIVATIAVALALPTFFELPLALVALSAGAPGLAAVLLFAGPIVNLPSLLIVGREVGPKTSLMLATGVWLLAVAAGLVTLTV
ncbi:MAG TPA: permease [Gemmatimonadaceae bacterium]|nr:permease [Gemmatimonadaceae bacterium]